MLEMMDFKGRDELLRKIQVNGNLYMQLQQWQAMAIALAQQYAPDKAAGLMQAAGQAVHQQGAGGAQAADVAGGKQEDTRVQKARENASGGAVPK